MHETKIWKKVLTPAEMAYDADINNRDSPITPMILRCSQGSDALYGASDWLFPDLTNNSTSTSSILMTFSNRSTDVPT